MADLSPQAQVVLDAYIEASDGCYVDGEWTQDHAGQLAAALLAAADQVVPDDPKEAKHFTTEAIRLSRQGIRRQFLSIAAELDPLPTPDPQP